MSSVADLILSIYTGVCIACFIVMVLSVIPRQAVLFKIYNGLWARHSKVYWKYFKKPPSPLMLFFAFLYHRDQMTSWVISLEILFSNKYALDPKLKKLFIMNRILLVLQILCLLVIFGPILFL